MEPTDTLHLLNETTIQPPSSICLDINLLGSMYSVHLAVKYAMGLHHTSATKTTTTSKSIILIGSYAGYNFNPNKPDYTAAKWGVRGLLRCFRTDLAQKHNIRMNMLAPCFIPTPMTHSRVPMLEKQGFRMGKLVDAVEVVWKMAVDTEMNGRAVTVGVDGTMDLGDDLGGNEGVSRGWRGLGGGCGGCLRVRRLLLRGNEEWLLVCCMKVCIPSSWAELLWMDSRLPIFSLFFVYVQYCCLSGLALFFRRTIRKIQKVGRSFTTGPPTNYFFSTSR